LKGGKVKGTQENRKAAYAVYERFGGRDIAGIIECLKNEHNIDISAQTLHQWKRDGNWNEALADTVGSHEERMLLKLMGLIEKYEHHLVEGDKPDPQAAYAYTNLIDSFLRLSSKMPRREASLEEMQRAAEEILENDYGIKRKLVSNDA
jgi:hypothetical protein